MVPSVLKEAQNGSPTAVHASLHNSLRRWEFILSLYWFSANAVPSTVVVRWVLLLFLRLVNTRYLYLPSSNNVEHGTGKGAVASGCCAKWAKRLDCYCKTDGIIDFGLWHLTSGHIRWEEGIENVIWSLFAGIRIRLAYKLWKQLTVHVKLHNELVYHLLTWVYCRVKTFSEHQFKMLISIVCVMWPRTNAKETRSGLVHGAGCFQHMCLKKASLM